LKISNRGVKTALVERFSPNVVVEVNHGGKLCLGSKVRMHSGGKLKVRKGAEMEIGAGVKANYNCIFVCRKHIEIGEGTEFGSNVLIYDHDHDYSVDLKEEKFKESPVFIGKNCWIGANTVILRGTQLGNNCVVGAGSVVKGIYPDGAVIVQKRNTEILRSSTPVS
jgi:acetyltransferase-like isoleucine patch superfamily enzyme